MNKSHHTKRRRRRSRHEWTEVLKDWAASGMEAEDYAEDHGLSMSSMMRWASRLGFSVGSGTRACEALRRNDASSAEFVPVHVMSNGTEAIERLPDTACIEVSTQNGSVVRIKGVGCEVALRAVFRALEGGAAC